MCAAARRILPRMTSSRKPDAAAVGGSRMGRLPLLADAGQTNKWLAEQLGKDPVTVSKWCTNTTQPDLQTLDKISDLLNVDIRELLVSKNRTNGFR